MIYNWHGLCNFLFLKHSGLGPTPNGWWVAGGRAWTECEGEKIEKAMPHGESVSGEVWAREKVRLCCCYITPPLCEGWGPFTGLSPLRMRILNKVEMAL